MVSRSLFLLAALLGSLILVGCDRSPKHASVMSVGILADLSGDGADWGQAELNGAKLALADAEASGLIGKGSVRLISLDAPAADIPASIAAYERLASESGIYAIVGPTWDDVAAAIAPRTTDDRIVVVAPDASSGVERDEDYPYFFSVFPPEASEMQALAAYLADEGLKTASTVFNDDPFSIELVTNFETAAKAAGLTIVSKHAVPDPDARDFRAIIARIKQIAPDVVYIEMASQGAKGPFMVQARELELNAQIASSSTTNTESLVTEFGSALEGIVFASAVETEAEKKFLQTYSDTYKNAPSAPSAPYAYDATMMLLKAIAAEVRPGPDLRDFLLGIDYDGLSSSHMTFSESGRVQWPPSAYGIFEITGGQVVQRPDRLQ